MSRRHRPSSSPPAGTGQAPSATPPAAGTEDSPAGTRLQKLLASAGYGSRRACEEIIASGRVEIDGKVVTELGTRVDPQRQETRVDGELVRTPRLVYWAIHKPAGVVCTMRDPDGRPRVTDLLPPLGERVFAVGRLDLESEGLILATNDGELALKLTHPRFGVEKVYQAQVAGEPTQEVLDELRKGVYLAEGMAKAKQVFILQRHKGSTILEITLNEGRNRQLRRMLARVGHKVMKLRRIEFGGVELGKLTRGEARPLEPRELQCLRDATRGIRHPRRSDAKRKRPLKATRAKGPRTGAAPPAGATEGKRIGKARPASRTRPIGKTRPASKTRPAAGKPASAPPRSARPAASPGPEADYPIISGGASRATEGARPAKGKAPGGSRFAKGKSAGGPRTPQKSKRRGFRGKRQK